jgi:hypothetical protein
MPAIVASMPRASIRNQNVPYRTTRRRQNIHYSLFIQGISRSIYAEGKGSSIIYNLCGLPHLVHLSSMPQAKYSLFIEFVLHGVFPLVFA